MTHKRFFLGDPSLVDYSGHCFGYIAALKQALESRGESIVILANRGVNPQLSSEVGAFPTFSLWCDARPVPFGAILPKAYQNRLVRRINEKQMLQDLRRFADTYSVDKDDVLVINTLRHWSIRAVVNWLEQLKPQQAPQVVLILHFTAFPDPDYALDDMQNFYVEAFRSIENSPLKDHISLMSDSEALIHEYELISHLTFHLAPIPHAFAGQSVRVAPRKEKIRIIYPGEARENKGFHLLPYLTNGFNRTVFADAVQFHIHAYCHNTHQDFYRKAMRQFTGKNVVFYFEQMTGAEYENFLHSADMVVLPYTRTNYYRQTSGPFSEAIAAAKPTVVPKGTWMADMLRIHSAGLAFNPEDAQDLLDVTLDAVSNIEDLAERARLASVEWRAFHNSDSLADLIYFCVNERN
jgi:glycosyltransferase involved in cell wall biosynthesis